MSWGCRLCQHLFCRRYPNRSEAREVMRPDKHSQCSHRCWHIAERDPTGVQLLPSLSPYRTKSKCGPRPAIRTDESEPLVIESAGIAAKEGSEEFEEFIPLQNRLHVWMMRNGGGAHRAPGLPPPASASIISVPDLKTSSFPFPLAYSRIARRPATIFSLID